MDLSKPLPRVRVKSAAFVFLRILLLFSVSELLLEIG